MQSINIFGVDKPEGRLDVAHVLGSRDLTMFVYDLKPGSSSSPYHYEYEEEWLLVLEGTLVLRAPDGEHELQRGDLVRFPSGPEGAHKVINRGDVPARTLMFSSSRVPSISVYPDSDKIGVWSDNETDGLIFKRATAVPWSDGEEGWHLAS